jgi:hypothetical protein
LILVGQWGEQLAEVVVNVPKGSVWPQKPSCADRTHQCDAAVAGGLVVDVKAIGAHRRKDGPDSIDDVRWQQHRVVRLTYQVSAAKAERSEVFVRCKPKLARPSENDIDPGKNGRESRARNFSNTPLENLSVERDDLGNVGNGRLCEACIARREENVSRGLGPLHLRSERHTDCVRRGIVIRQNAAS